MQPETPANPPSRIARLRRDFKSMPRRQRWTIIGAVSVLVVALVAAAVLLTQFGGPASAPTGPGVNPSAGISAGQGVGGAPTSSVTSGRTDPRPHLRAQTRPRRVGPGSRYRARPALPRPSRVLPGPPRLLQRGHQGCRYPRSSRSQPCPRSHPSSRRSEERHLDGRASTHLEARPASFTLDYYSKIG
jgi:hypothetical protein